VSTCPALAYPTAEAGHLAYEAAALAWLRQHDVYRGQWCGAGALRTDLPAMTFGTERAAEHYAAIPNDHNLANSQEISPEVFRAKLEVTKVYCRTALGDCDPFFDLDTLLNDFGRDLVDNLVKTCASSIENTNAFEELHTETGMPLKEMVAAYPGGISHLPPMDAYIAMRQPAFIEALIEAGYDAVAIGGAGDTHGEMEWHIWDPALAIDPDTLLPLPCFHENHDLAENLNGMKL
jgi:hypothetical protein